MVLPARWSLGGAAEYVAPLPLADLGSTPSLASLKTYARAADEFGYEFLCVNDHPVFSRPWLDGRTTLAAVIDESGSMRLATTVSLPVLRGPVPLAKTLAALDVLSNGRLLVAVGPGSSAQDYAAVGVPFGERWRRFDEAVLALRALLRGDRNGIDGEFYKTRGVLLEPSPARPGGRRCGSRVGARRPVCDGWRPPETFGSHRRTTRPRNASASVWPSYPRSLDVPVRGPTSSRTLWPPHGCTSRRIPDAPSE
jgi:alkanesulfonate monooxygenase SsuD/methylene tetrahydromethanopterin reductase-like flavin-dependent oxidoreductase (luciferase family)